MTAVGLHNRKRLCALALSLESRDSFLDLGSGESGDLLSYALSTECDRIVAIDVDGTKLVRSRIRSGNTVDLIRASGTHIPLKDGTLSKIAMVEVIEHLPKGSEVESLREIRRVLKVGGKFFLSTPNKRVSFMILDPAIALGHRHYSLVEIERIISESGLRVLGLWTCGGFMEALATPIFYVLRRIRLAGHEMPRVMLNLIEKEYAFPNKRGYTVAAICIK